MNEKFIKLIEDAIKELWNQSFEFNYKDRKFYCISKPRDFFLDLWFAYSFLQKFEITYHMRDKYISLLSTWIVDNLDDEMNVLYEWFKDYVENNQDKIKLNRLKAKELYWHKD